MIRRVAGIVLAMIFWCAASSGQERTGELRITVCDATGAGLPAIVELSSGANRRALKTTETGVLIVRSLEFGSYRVTARANGFSASTQTVSVGSELPKGVEMKLAVSAVETQVVVESLTEGVSTESGNEYSIGPVQLEQRNTSSAGRAIIDAVNSQPGWLLEANGTLHPRGSEYGVQYVQDGFPFTDNRSPQFSSSPNPEDIQSLTVMTANYPAEFGRKLGGVVEVNSGADSRLGFHGGMMFDAGSFGTAEESLDLQWGTQKGAVRAAISGLRTDRYLDPPGEVALNDSARNVNVSVGYDRDLSSRDNIRMAFWRGGSHFSVPNELEQQTAGQNQLRRNEEMGGHIALHHVFTPSLLGTVRMMARDLNATLDSNPLSTPIMPVQDRGFREVYAAASLAGQHGRHNWKAGTDYVRTAIHESFSYVVTAATRFEGLTALTFQFAERKTGRDQSAFVQDDFALGRFTFSAGLRWDSYRLLVNDSAFSPRLGMGWRVPGLGATIYASYDRIFTTPASENLLLSSSSAAQSLTDSSTGLPVSPSTGNYYQVGVRKVWADKVRTNANFFVRDVNNFADDDLLLNTGVSFPIAFARGQIHGFEAKIETINLGPLWGYVSYSNQVGTGSLPITGGLLLDDGAQALLNSTGRFPISQDQRNTVRAEFRYQMNRKLWTGMNGWYGSGLPVELEGSPDMNELAAKYSSAVLSRVNFAAGRVRPSSSVGISVGSTVWTRNEHALQLQASVDNVFDRLNVINFAGLLSGTALSPPRQYGLRARFSF